MWAIDLQCLCLIELGREREVETHLQLAIQVATSLGDTQAVARLSTRRVSVLVRLRDPGCAAALAEAERSIPQEDRAAHLVLADSKARWLLRTGRAAEARRLLVETILPEELALRRWREHLLSLALLADVEHALGDRLGAARLLRNEVIPGFDRRGFARSAGLARFNLAILLLEHPTPAGRKEATQLLHRALATARRLHLPEASRIAQQLDQHRLPQPRR